MSAMTGGPAERISLASARAWRRIGGTERGPALLAWACVVALTVAASFLIDGFLTMPAIRSIFALCAILGIAAAGQTLVVVLGGIDLSIPALMTLTAVGITELGSRGWPPALSLLTLAAVCVAIGALNGVLATTFRVHPLIVTLGVGFMVAGGLLAWTEGKPEGSPPHFIAHAAAAASTMGPIPLPPIVAVWAAVAVLTIMLATRTPFGRRTYAFGASPAAAESALVRRRTLWAGVFAYSGFTSFVAGVMLSGFTGYGDLRAGDPYLFSTVAAVILGGTSLLGGRGGYGRTIAGTLVLTLAQLILVGRGVTSSMQQVTLGVIIVAFVALYGRDRHLRDRV